LVFFARYDFDVPESGPERSDPFSGITKIAVYPGMRDETRIDLDKLVGERAVKAQSLLVIGMKADPVAIVVFLRRAQDRKQLKSGELSDAPEGVLQALLLCGKLSIVLNVLPGATAALPEIRTRRLLALGRRFYQAGKLAESIVSPFFYDADFRLISGSREGDEDDLAVPPADAVRPVGQRVDLQDFCGFFRCHGRKKKLSASRLIGRS